MNLLPFPRLLMFLGLVATGLSVMSGLLRGKSPSVGWFVAGLILFFGGRLLEKRGVGR